jgi:hypothetical protein
MKVERRHGEMKWRRKMTVERNGVDPVEDVTAIVRKSTPLVACP